MLELNRYQILSVGFPLKLALLLILLPLMVCCFHVRLSLSPRTVRPFLLLLLLLVFITLTYIMPVVIGLFHVLNADAVPIDTFKFFFFTALPHHYILKRTSLIFFNETLVAVRRPNVLFTLAVILDSCLSFPMRG